MKILYYIKRHSIATSFVLVVFVIAISFGVHINSGRAIDLSSLGSDAAIKAFVDTVPVSKTMFGGPIEDVTYCICSDNLKITVGEPVGGTFMYDAGTKLDSFYQIFRPGPWVLGYYSPGGACVQLGETCFIIPTTGTITEVGTSL